MRSRSAAARGPWVPRGPVSCALATWEAESRSPDLLFSLGSGRINKTLLHTHSQLFSKHLSSAYNMKRPWLGADDRLIKPGSSP